MPGTEKISAIPAFFSAKEIEHQRKFYLQFPPLQYLTWHHKEMPCLQNNHNQKPPPPAGLCHLICKAPRQKRRYRIYFRYSRISAALVSGLTLGMTFSMMPSSSITYVVLTTPKVTLPYIFFSCQTS